MHIIVCPSNHDYVSGLVAAPAQAVALTLRARDLWPVLMSAAVPAGTVLGVVPGALTTVIDPSRTETSSEALVHMETEPGDIVDIGGEPMSSFSDEDRERILE